MNIKKVIAVEELFSKEFESFLWKWLEDRKTYLLESDPNEYGGEWDSNPYDVEPQLASGSGCWFYPEWGEDAALDDAKEDFMEEFRKDCIEFPESMKEINSLIEYLEANDKEWIEAILVYILNKQ